MSVDPLSENISVVIRVRPLNTLEGNSCITISQHTISLDLKTETKQFSFDYVAAESVSQEMIFNLVGKPLTDACLEGYNATVFAYGQTGAGKTFTIQGLSPDQALDKRIYFELRGLMPRIVDYIFDKINIFKQRRDISYIVKASYLEIFREQIIDLLDSQTENLRIREGLKQGVYIEGLNEEIVDTSGALKEVISRGTASRHTGATAMNQESSRSHSVLTLRIESKTVTDGIINIKTSRFHIIDLAGSERQKSTDAAGERLKEAGNINRSLSVLGNVINALAETSQGKSRYVHYRDSKLTFLLKDSLGGNSKTVLIGEYLNNQ